jgi:hypothetical protein
MSADEPAIDVPEQFRENFDSLADALHAQSTTDADAQKRCPEPDCGATDIRKKSPSGEDIPQRKPGDWRCKNCGAHFDDPRPPRNETAGRQATLGEVTE